MFSLILVLNVLKFTSIKAFGLLSNNYVFEDQRNISQNYSTEIFSIICNRSWTILATIPSTIDPFPLDLFSISSGLSGYQVIPDCEVDAKLFFMKFFSPNCKIWQKSATYETPKFAISIKDSDEFHIKYSRYSGCEFIMKFGKHGTANIGYVNEYIWYLVQGVQTNIGLQVGIIILGRNISDALLDKNINETMLEINESFYNNNLVDFHKELKTRNDDMQCGIQICNEIMKARESFDTKRKEWPVLKSQFKEFLILYVMNGLVLLILLGLIVNAVVHQRMQQQAVEPT